MFYKWLLKGTVPVRHVVHHLLYDGGGGGGVLFKSRDISVTEVSLLVQFLSIITEAWPFYNKW